MINNKLIIAAVFIALLSILFVFVSPILNYSIASGPIDDPNSFRPNKTGSDNGDIHYLTRKGNRVFGVISTVGIVASAITMVILGLKYMMGSSEEKAEYKKSMIPYIIGIVLLLSVSTILRLIAFAVTDVGLI